MVIIQQNNTLLLLTVDKHWPLYNLMLLMEELQTYIRAIYFINMYNMSIMSILLVLRYDLYNNKWDCFISF